MRISYNPPPGQRRDIGSPRSSAGGPDGPGSVPSGERSHAELIDANGKKPIDLLDIGAAGGSAGGSTRPRRSSGARRGRILRGAEPEVAAALAEPSTP
jgi:hypothetical protein